MIYYLCGQCGRDGHDPAMADGLPLCYDCGTGPVATYTDKSQPPELEADLREFWWPRDAAGEFLKLFPGK